MRRIQVLLLVALTILAGAAFPQAPGSRQEALAGLASTEAATRAAAVLWIARNGLAEDDALGMLFYAQFLMYIDPRMSRYWRSIA